MFIVVKTEILMEIVCTISQFMVMRNYKEYTYKTPSSIKTVTITDATQIPSGAFANNKNVTKVVLNDGIISIGDYAFKTTHGTII